MLGQDDDPAHIAEQMRKSQVDERSGDAVPITGPNGEKYYVDRRSYLAKSVPQRMAIISAGVIMNVIFAFIFAVIAYGMGVPYTPSIVSETIPGSPAWKANIEPGDEIVEINNRVDPTFVQLQGSVTLGDLQKGIRCRVRRASDGKIVPMVLTPQQENGRLATIGIRSPQSLTIVDVVEDSPAARATLVGSAGGKIAKADARLEAGDEVVRVGDTLVKDYREFSAELARHGDEAIRVTVRRQPDADKKAVDGANAQAKAGVQELTFEVPKQPLQGFDFELKMGPITSVRNDSPASEAGLLAGDVIEKVDGKQLGEGTDPLETWTAATLPDYLYRAAKAGRDVEIVVRREKQGGQSTPVTIHVKPIVPSAIIDTFPPRLPGTPMATNEIGIAYRVDNKIAAVTPNTPAAAKLAPGDILQSAKVIFPEIVNPPPNEKGETPANGETPPPLIVKLAPRNRLGWRCYCTKSLAAKSKPDWNRTGQPCWMPCNSSRNILRSSWRWSAKMRSPTPSPSSRRRCRAASSSRAAFGSNRSS